MTSDDRRHGDMGRGRESGRNPETFFLGVNDDQCACRRESGIVLYSTVQSRVCTVRPTPKAQKLGFGSMCAGGNRILVNGPDAVAASVDGAAALRAGTLGW